MQMYDYAGPAEQLELTIPQIMSVIQKIPTTIQKWNKISSRELREWFVMDDESITVNCKVANRSDVVTVCKIHPSKKVPAIHLGTIYYAHQNAKITASFEKGSPAFRELPDVLSAVRIIGDFLDPGIRPPILPSVIITIQSIDLTQSCNNIDKILDFVQYYDVNYSIIKSDEIAYGVNLHTFNRSKFNKVEIHEALKTRKGLISATVHTDAGSSMVVVSDEKSFTTGEELMIILIELGVPIDRNITQPKRLRCMFESNTKTHSPNMTVLMAALEKMIDKLILVI